MQLHKQEMMVIVLVEYYIWCISYPRKTVQRETMLFDWQFVEQCTNFGTCVECCSSDFFIYYWFYFIEFFIQFFFYFCSLIFAWCFCWLFPQVCHRFCLVWSSIWHLLVGSYIDTELCHCICNHWFFEFISDHVF